MLLVVSVLCVVSSPVMAGMGVWMNYPPAGFDRYGSAGPFQATVTNLTGYSDPILGHSVNTSFLTFCIESNEYFTPGNWYVVGLSNTAYKGGVGGGSPDPLSNATAHLYLQYQMLSLADQKAQGDDYQAAIWWFENELAGDTPVNTLAANAIAAWGARSVNYTGSSVMVMNLSNGSVAQDMLVSFVPAPGAALLAFVGVGLVGWMKKRLA